MIQSTPARSGGLFAFLPVLPADRPHLPRYDGSMELILSPLTGRLIRGACFVVAVLVGAVSIYFTISQGSKPLFDHIGKMGPTPTAKTTAR